jgi:hypothetical protein
MGVLMLIDDIFISYARKDQGTVDQLVAALQEQGLRVWQDRREIDDGAAITQGIVDGLANARMLLAWYSDAYAQSRPCQWELTAAYLAAQHDGGKINPRILVVNPQEGAGHVQQDHLRDCQHLPGTLPMAELAARIAACDRTLPPFRTIQALGSPTWHTGQRRTGSNRFVGRVQELWEIHNGLIAGDLAIISGKPAGNDLVQVHGMGGMGKSLLAEEYALRFGAAYPGGIFWLSAFPSNESVAPFRQRESQISALVERLGIELREDDKIHIIDGKIYKFLQYLDTYLWIVDDIPSSASADLMISWCAPTKNGKTLITTRGNNNDGNGKIIKLNTLHRKDAMRLLTRFNSIKEKTEEDCAHKILNLLGDHALAIDVTAPALRTSSYCEIYEYLSRPDKDSLEIVSRFKGNLPNGHEKSVANTILRSVKSISKDSLLILRVASIFPPIEIPLLFLSNFIIRTKSINDMEMLGIIDSLLDEGLLEKIRDKYVIIHSLVSRVIHFFSPADKEIIRNARESLSILIEKSELKEISNALNILIMELNIAHGSEIADGSLYKNNINQNSLFKLYYNNLDLDKKK